MATAKRLELYAGLYIVAFDAALAFKRALHEWLVRLGGRLEAALVSLPKGRGFGAALQVHALCIGLWIRAKTVDQDERGNAERRALFVGLWPPMFWLIGDSVEGHERRGRRPWR